MDSHAIHDCDGDDSDCICVPLYGHENRLANPHLYRELYSISDIGLIDVVGMQQDAEETHDQFKLCDAGIWVILADDVCLESVYN